MPNLTDRPNYRVPWSQDDLARMTDMLSRGETIADIAKTMGRSQEAVRNRATAAGLMKKRMFRPRDSKPS